MSERSPMEYKYVRNYFGLYEVIIHNAISFTCSFHYGAFCYEKGQKSQED